MSQSGGDFHLSDEILALIPTDPYEQLDLARKITSMAIASRVSRLEGEAGHLRQKVAEKDKVIAELQERLAELDRMFREADARLQTLLEENINLSKERDSLALTAKKLSRELAKLEAFKRNLMQSLNEDDSSSHMETVDIGTYDQFVPKASTWKGFPYYHRQNFFPACVTQDGGSVGNGASNYVSTSMDIGNTYKEGQRNIGQKIMTSYVSPRLTPSATPKLTSSGGSPRGYSAAGSPKLLSGTTSPIKHRMDGQRQIVLSPWYPSSQLSSASNSPPRGRPLPGRTPRIDGKEFFRQARNRLSYEQFGAFLANIKEFNAHKQTREETLRKAEEIFGTDSKDLYLSFQGLLNRNVP